MGHQFFPSREHFEKIWYRNSFNLLLIANGSPKIMIYFYSNISYLRKKKKFEGNDSSTTESFALITRIIIILYRITIRPISYNFFKNEMICVSLKNFKGRTKRKKTFQEICSSYTVSTLILN